MSDGEVDRDQANVMAGRICAAAGLSAQSECELLERIGEFDAVNAIRWWVDVKSLAHWLSWCCSMTPGTAREHVRVAKAMRRMPTVTAAFRAGRLSYSKVREVTRVVDVLDEEQLCQMAVTATASQLARMLAGYRSAAGSRIRQERTRTLTWHERDDGMIDFRLRMPKEEAALVIAALTAAKDQHGTPPPAPCPDLPDQPTPPTTLENHAPRDTEATPAGPTPGGPTPAGSTPVGPTPAGSTPAGSTPVQSHTAASDPVEPNPVEPDTVEPNPLQSRAAQPATGHTAEPFEPATTPARYPLAERRAGARRRARTEAPLDTTPTYGYADAILDIARTFLDTTPEDRSGEDRTIVVVHVAAEHLTGHTPPQQPPAHVPAGTPAADDQTRTGAEPATPTTTTTTIDVPAGTPANTPAAEQPTPRQPSGPATGTDPHPIPPTVASVPAGRPAPPATAPTTPPASEHGTPSDPTCHIQGLGGIEPETARRLACDADLITAVIDSTGEVLALGRTRRLVSRAQRRALMIRDSICQFPACHQSRHLQAHHILPWSQGGPTDLDNLILLCQFHHTTVHEGGITIHPGAHPAPGHRWDFVMPDGRPHQDWYDAEALAYLLAEQSPRQHADHAAIIDSVDRFDHPHARRILPGWRGERLDLHECVQALFRMQLPHDNQADEEWAAA